MNSFQFGPTTVAIFQFLGMDGVGIVEFFFDFEIGSILWSINLK